MISKEKELFVFSEYPVRFQLLHHFSEITCLGVVAFQNQMAQYHYVLQLNLYSLNHHLVNHLNHRI